MEASIGDFVRTPSVPALILIANFGLTALAAAPGEVPATAAFSGDDTTYTWSTVPGAISYNVYRGSNPGGHDQTCRIVHTTSTSAFLSEYPSGSGSLFFFLVSAVGPDGEGTLGPASDGAARPNGSPCADADGDLAPDNLDNCPLASNPSQADQDDNGDGDRCDPKTYDFEATLSVLAPRR